MKIAKLFKGNLFIVFLLSLGISCSQELKLESFQACDYFTSQGICKEPWEVKKTYKVDPTLSTKPLLTWENLSQYLYFTARETPGFVLYANRSFTETERAKLRANCSAEVEFRGTRYHMEGREIGYNFVGFFQYLGSIIAEDTKKTGINKDKILTELLFPAELIFYWNCNSETGVKKLWINLLLESKS